MRLIPILSGLLLAAIVLALSVFRLAPTDPSRWHVDPRTGKPGAARFVVRPEGGDIPGDAYPVDPTQLLAAFDRVAIASPRTRRVAGSVREGRITYVSRSRIFGFPDFTTVEAIAGDGGARLIVFARSRFGQNDLGVNRARVSGWLAVLQP